jgi:hypothetical protein
MSAPEWATWTSVNGVDHLVPVKGFSGLCVTCGYRHYITCVECHFPLFTDATDTETYEAGPLCGECER